MSTPQFNLTIEDAVILHLQPFARFHGDFDAPYAITQPGIAESIGIRRSHVSNVIKGLKHKNYVTDRIAHVKNLVRKRKIYTLTHEGGEYASRLKSNLDRIPLNLIEKSGKMKKTRLLKINDYLKTRIPLIRLVNLITPDNTIEVQKIIDHEIHTESARAYDIPGNKLVNFIDDMVQPTRFVGRVSEIVTIKNWLEDKKPRIIIISGIPGVGKTTLISRVIDDYSQLSTRSMFWYRIHEWNTLRGTLRDLSEFLIQLGRKKLKFYLDTQANIELHDIKKIFEDDLSKLEGMLVFDDFHNIDEQLEPLFSMIVEIMGSEDFENLKLVILSREPVAIYDRRDVAINKIVTEYKLGGLDEGASKQLLDINSLSDSYFENIYKISGGHPLTLELINIHIKDKGEENFDENLDELFQSGHDLNKYLRDEILKELTGEEKKLLELISVFRYPVSPEAFFTSEEIDYGCVDRLLGRSFIQETTTGYEAHELLKEFFYRRLNPQLKLNYHMEAAMYYSNVINLESNTKGVDIHLKDGAIIEAIYHNIMSDNHENAALLGVDYGDELIRRGYTEELALILPDILEGRISKDLKADLLINLGQILAHEGEWDSAFDCYQDGLNIYNSLEDKKGMAKAYNSSGTIHYRKGNWDQAMEYYNAGLDIAEAMGDTENCSKIYSNIALVNWSTGKLDEAKELLKKSLGLSEKLEDKQGIARANNNLGIIHWERKEFDEAIVAYNRSLRLSIELGDKRTIAILYDNLGEAYRLKGEFESAIDYYNKSLSLSEELGFKWQIAEVNSNLGRIFKATDSARSYSYLKTALDIFTNLGAEKEIEKVKEIIDEK